MPVDGPALQRLIADALAVKPFSISGDTLSSAPITTLLTDQLGADAITLTNARIVSQTETTAVLAGQMTQAVLGLQGLTAEATFSTDGTTPQLTVVLTGLPSSWNPAKAYPTLTDGIVNALAWSSCSLLLDSSGALAPPSGYPATYGLPALAPGMTLTTGLGLQATVAPTTATPGLAWLMGAGSWTVRGPLSSADGLPALVLTSPISDGLEFASYTFPFQLTLASVPVLLTNQIKVTQDVLQLHAAVEKDIGVGKSITLPFIARMRANELGVVRIASDLPSGSGITLEQLDELLAGGTTKGQLPSSGIPVLDDIELERVELAIVPAKARLLAAGVSVGYASPSPWQALDGMIEIEQVTVGFYYVPTATSSMTTQMSALIKLGGGHLDATIDLPAVTFSAELEAGQTIDLTAMVKAATDDTISMPQGVSCTELKLSGDLLAESYRFQATVSTPWKLTGELALNDIGMDISYDPLAGASGEVVGTFTIAGCELCARASYLGKSEGWSFAGGTMEPITVTLSELIGEVKTLFGVELPTTTTPSDFTLENLNLSYTTGTSEFTLTALSAIEIAGHQLDLGVEIAHGSTGKSFRGLIWFDQSAFTIDFEDNQTAQLTATWAIDSGDPPLTLEAIAGEFGLPLPTLPSELELEFVGATLSYVPGSGTVVITIETKSGGEALLAVVPDASGKEHQLIVGAGIGGKVSLADLPLVGAELSKLEALSASSLRAFATAKPLAANTARSVNSLLTSGTLTLPEAGLTGDLTFAGQLEVGTDVKQIVLSAGGGATTSATTALVAPSPGAGSQPPSPATSGTTWLSVQRSFGPVSVRQVGVMYAAGTLWFEISGALTAGPVSLELDGLGLGVPLKDPSDVKVRLDGLGVSYAAPPLLIAGSLVNLSPLDGSSLDFQGGVVIEAEAFTLEAFGYYGTGGSGAGDHFPSMFLFLEGAAEIGGPPFLFVTGFALGFGYNSQVRLPAVAEVAEFPMIAALPGSPQYNAGALGGANPSPLTVLETLTSAQPPWIAPSRGEFWGAAGITFTTFELVQSQALLLVEAGNQLSLALLGLSTARFPTEGSSVYAQIELELEARLEPAAGELWFEALLSPSSFVLDPACHLTGGFAFCLWFGHSEHAGDFVLTLGGYHPAFSPPSYYPTVPALGFSWQLGGDVTVGGKAYLALTPSAFMLGGELDVTFQSGNLRAWLNAGADVIVHWNPFWFDASISISVGVSYRLDLLFTTVTLSVELGAELELWGPPTGGEVTVDWYVISFSIPFGSSEPDAAKEVSWSTVTKALPIVAGQHTPTVLSITAVAGLTPAASGSSPPPSAGDRWLVRGSAFAFSTLSPVPASRMTVGTSYKESFETLDVRPLGVTGLTSSHTLSVLDQKQLDVSEAFSIVANQAGVPASLWGGPSDPQQVPSAAGQLLSGRAVGLTLTVKQPITGASAGPMAVAGVLSHEDLECPGAALAIAPGAKPSGPIPSADPEALTRVSGPEGISSGTAAQARGALIAQLAAAEIVVAPGVTPTSFAEQAGSYLVAEPMLAAAT